MREARITTQSRSSTGADGRIVKSIRETRPVYGEDEAAGLGQMSPPKQQRRGERGAKSLENKKQKEKNKTKRQTCQLSRLNPVKISIKKCIIELSQIVQTFQMGHLQTRSTGKEGHCRQRATGIYTKR